MVPARFCRWSCGQALDGNSHQDEQKAHQHRAKASNHDGDARSVADIRILALSEVTMVDQRSPSVGASWNIAGVEVLRVVESTQGQR